MMMIWMMMSWPRSPASNLTAHTEEASACPPVLYNLTSWCNVVIVIFPDDLLMASPDSLHRRMLSHWPLHRPASLLRLVPGLSTERRNWPRSGEWPEARLTSTSWDNLRRAFGLIYFGWKTFWHFHFSKYLLLQFNKCYMLHRLKVVF